MSIVHGVDACTEVSIRGTEVTDRVGDAVENIFPGAELDREPGRSVGEVYELECFSERLREQTTLDIARREFVKRHDDDGFPFALRKQAAFKGVVNLSVGNPDELGDIEVHVIIRNPSVDEVIDYVTPLTEEGRPTDPNDR